VIACTVDRAAGNIYQLGYAIGVGGEYAVAVACEAPHLLP